MVLKARKVAREGGCVGRGDSKRGASGALATFWMVDT